MVWTGSGAEREGTEGGPRDGSGRIANRIDAVDRLGPEGMVRVCCGCKTPRSHADFHRDRKDHRFGIQRVCKACVKQRPPRKRPRTAEHYRKKYEAHKDAVVFNSRAHYRTLRGRFLTLISAARGRAKKRGLEHDIDIAWALDAWDRQGGCCVITGIPLELEIPVSKTRELNPFAPSLDRIDSGRGYTKDNVRIVCVIVNLAMNRFGLEAFQRMMEGWRRS